MSELVRVALVTGASRGIGRAIAVELARAGHDLVVNYHSNHEAAAEVVREIESLGRRGVAVGADVATAEGRRRLVDAAWSTLGELTVLVNNAGITSPGRRDLLELTEESWDTVLGTNLKGPFFLAQAAARGMVERPRGDGVARRIINVSSLSAFTVSTNRVDYCIAKGAMQMMTWQLAARLAEHGIAVFEVCPGVIASDMTAPVQEKYDRLIAEGLSPIRRWGQPEDVARAVVALAGDAWTFSTGDRIHVDGGFHIRRL